MYANNTFLNNHANTGGVITSNVDINYPVFFNSIFSGNTANIGKDVYAYGDLPVVVSYSNIDPAGVYGNWIGEDIINVDPEIVDDSCHIAMASPCIEAGAVSFEVNGFTYECPDHDMDGQPRPLNATADMGVDEVLLTAIPSKFNKSANSMAIEIYPNPVSGNTMIEFSLPKSESVDISIYDITGKLIQTILAKKLPKGNHKINWNAEGMNEGIYFIRLETSAGTLVRKVVLLE